MIFDRNSNDVIRSLELRKKIQKGYDLTEEETEEIERGTLTINTLNRIEDKISELKNILDDMDYKSENLTSYRWNFGDFFLQKDFERILDSIKKLKNSFFVYQYTPDIPGLNYRHFQNINDVEKIIFDISQMIDDVLNNYRECGNTECGEDSEVDEIIGAAILEDRLNGKRFLLYVMDGNMIIREMEE